MRPPKGTPRQDPTPEQRAYKKARNEIIQRNWMAGSPYCFEMGNRIKYDSEFRAQRVARQLHEVLGESLMRAYWCFYSKDGVGHWHLTSKVRMTFVRPATHEPLDVIVGAEIVRVWCGPPAPQPYPPTARRTGRI